MRIRLLQSCALAAGLAFAGLAPPLAAEEMTTQSKPGAATIDEDRLEAFVDAALEVDELSRRWTPQIEGAPDEQTAADLRDEATEEMVDAVEDEGLTTDEYNRIYLAAREDPELRSRIRDMIDQRAE